jgi:hypothetical protein
MVQRTKREASWGILGGFRGILGAIAFGFVFSFGLGNGLPSHILGTIGTATLQRNNVIYNPSLAPSCRFPSRRAGMRLTELMLCVVGTHDSPAIVPSARLTLSSGEARKTQNEYKN